MRSVEFIVSENEWRDLISVKDYFKSAFDVDIKRKKKDDTTDHCLPAKHQWQQNDTSQSGEDDAHRYGGEDVNNVKVEEYKTSTISRSIDDGEMIFGSPPVIALLETRPSAEENLEKCIKFMCAFTPSNPDYRSITLSVENQRALDMVQDSATSIQQSTSALICIQPEQLGFTIKGHHSCVELARQKIDMILRDTNSTLNADNCTLSQKAVWPDLNTPDNTIKTNFGCALFDGAQTKKLDKMINDPVPFSAVIENKSSVTSHENLREPCESSCDDTIEEDYLLADDRLRKQVDQASKCGFSDKQISNVLKKLDINCSMDDMMKGLIQEPQEDDDPVMCLTANNEEEDLSSDEFDVDDSSNLRDIIIDGSNVAMSHGQKVFSCKGIKIAVDWFKSRGHKNITVFVPQWRKEASRPDAPISDQEILTELEEERIVVFTPSRRVGGTRIVCYDDRFVLKLAALTNGIIVSNDVYRDLVRESDAFKDVVEKRLLMYTFVKDTFMPPEDPLGRQGPSLDNFLRIKPAVPKHRPQNCPYGKKCTYGMKCKYYHPERRHTPQKMVAEKLKENAELRLKLSKSCEALEKGKVSKPRLSRTVSWVPSDTEDSPLSQVTSQEDQRKLLPLLLSKSLVNPNSYLTEQRLKMEQAESEESNGNAVLINNIKMQNSDVNTGKINKLNSDSALSPGTSPSPIEVTPASNFPPSPAPDFPSYTGPAGFSVSVSKAESQGLSGHLLVAKKLSDENCTSQNFFAQHTSRAPGTPPQDKNINSYKEQCLSPDNVSSPVSVKPLTATHSQDFESLESQEIFLPPDIPFQPHKKPPGMGLTREDSAFSSYTPISPLSGDYSSGPVFPQGAKKHQHQHFKRSMSSTAPSRSSEHQIPRNMDRKFSLNMGRSMQPSENYLQTRGPALVQPNFPIPPPNQSFLSRSYQREFLHRKKESFDSAFGSGLNEEQPVMFLSPTEDMVSPFYNTTHTQSPTYFSPPPNFTQPIMQQQSMVYMSSPLRYAPPGNAITSQAHVAYPPPHTPSNPWQWQNSSSPNRFFGHGGIDVSTSGAMQQGQHHSQLVNSPQFGIHNAPPPQPQAMHTPYYPTPELSFYSMAAYGTDNRSESMYEPGMPLSPFSPGPPMKPRINKDIDEEAPISVDDPRYAIYYNLSSVFGERVVRTFMNRNPDSGSNIKNLYSMISAYKQERGM